MTSVGRLGQVLLRGTVSEVGAERYESVGLDGAHAVRTVGGGMLMAVPRAIGILLGLLFAPLRLLLIPSLTSSGRRDRRPERIDVPVTPFVVSADDGEDYDCIIRGEIRGGFLKLGDAVEVRGRMHRTRVVHADRVESLRTHATTRGWVDPRVRTAPLQAVLGVAMVLFLIWVLVSLHHFLAG